MANEKPVAEDPDCERRIANEVIVDCYNEIERAMGWYYHLEDKLLFPLQATCIKQREISPLAKGEVVTVTGMADESECEHEMFVAIRWQKRKLAVPISQLNPVDADEETQEGVADWHYWVARGYIF
jgi:hypothetical protein